MRSKFLIGLFVVTLFSSLALTFSACDLPVDPPPAVSNSGVQEHRVTVEVGLDGLSSEQRNIDERYEMDNAPGAIKHLYVISAYSGDCILYSTVREKVTSSGKRLTPKTVVGTDGQYVDGRSMGMLVNIAGQNKYTQEVIQDDGTYGESIDYLYWKDQRGNYHQHYPSGGQIVHVSDVPMSWPKIILNLEMSR